MKSSDRGYLEVNLPAYLQRDIEELKQGVARDVPYLDCLFDELYGSINAAEWDAEITREQARYLREKYL